MRFTLPPSRFLFKALLIAILLGSLGFFLFLALAPDGVDATVAFAGGAFLGGLIAAWLAGIGEPAAERPAEVKSVFVGNLAFKAKPRDVEALFARFGEVQSVRIMTDRATRRPRGFAFVEMPAPDAKKAIGALDGQEFLGRQLRVSEGTERKREENPGQD